MENQNAQVTNDLLNITAIMMKDPEGASVRKSLPVSISP